MARPKITQDPIYQLIRNEKIVEFNKLKASGKSCDLVGHDFRGLDLRLLDVDGLDLSGAYFRGADLRGLDFRNTKLEGASFASANISGVYFPSQITAAEIDLSVKYGTRVRYKIKKDN
jgi:uncharacterized protein YjbI with pentapeptide repeats